MEKIVKSILLSGLIACHITSTQAGITDYALAGISASCMCANYIIAKEIRWSQEAIKISQENINASQELQSDNTMQQDEISAYFASSSFIQNQRNCIAYHQQKIESLERAQSATLVASAITGIPLIP